MALCLNTKRNDIITISFLPARYLNKEQLYQTARSTAQQQLRENEQTLKDQQEGKELTIKRMRAQIQKQEMKNASFQAEIQQKV